VPVKPRPFFTVLVVGFDPVDFIFAMIAPSFNYYTLKPYWLKTVTGAIPSFDSSIIFVTCRPHETTPLTRYLAGARHREQGFRSGFDSAFLAASLVAKYAISISFSPLILN
jgi:hypothetical protein